MLACNRVTGRHTGDNIMMWYEEIISDFGVREKVKHIITDSASNVKKAFLTLPGYEDVEKDHTIGDDSEAEESERCDSANNFLMNQMKAKSYLNIMPVLHMCCS